MQVNKATAPAQFNHAISDGRSQLIRNVQYNLSQMLYETEDIWDRLTNTEKAQRIDAFLRTRNLLIYLTEEDNPEIESPWGQYESEEEYQSIGADPRYPDKWYKFAPGVLQVAHAHLMVAVAEEDSRLKGWA